MYHANHTAVKRAAAHSPVLRLTRCNTAGNEPVVDAGKRPRVRSRVEQNVPLSLGVADRACIPDDGKVVYPGSAADFAANHVLVKKLAGATAQH